MSFAFSKDELDQMQEIQLGHMMDQCKFQAVVITPNSFGEQVESWPVDGSAIDCGLEMQAGRERHGVDNTVVEYDAVLRVPLGTAFDMRDRVKITKRFGEVQASPLVYSIVGPSRFGPSGIRIMLKRVDL